MLVLACPGQGAQTPGFLAPWLELPEAAAHLAALSDAARVDLAAYGTTADADTIRDTAIAQPLIVAAGLVAHAALGEHAARVGVAAGHSVGEITAAAASAILTPVEAITLVTIRGRAMAEASALRPTGMSAVVGGDPDEVAATLDRHGLTPANRNGAGQVVAAGTLEQLAALAADPPAKARVMPLQVAGAFHTAHMAGAVDALAEHAAGLHPRDPAYPVVSNRDGQPVAGGADALGRIVDQVARPVRWDLVMETLAGMGVTGLIELAPAGTLVGLAKRGLKGVQCLALTGPDQLDAATAMLDEHGVVPAVTG